MRIENIFRNVLIIAIIILFLGASILPSISGIYSNNNSSKTSEPLPHYREGGTPYNSNQSLFPYSIQSTNLKDAPTSGLIESPPEYGPTQGVLFWYSSGSWSSVVTDLVSELTGDNQYDEAYSIKRTLQC